MISDLIQYFDHVGWVTDNLTRFEQFWVDILGFEKISEGILESDMTLLLFGIPGPADVRRYSWGDDQMDIEVHVFNGGSIPTSQSFNRFGINHCCFHVTDREALLKQLPETVTRHIYHNPKGWKNMFIQDFEGNWIELREKFK